MSRPNPTHRECWKCGAPPAAPWPGPELCQPHLDADKADQLTNPGKRYTVAGLMEAAQLVSHGKMLTKQEFNGPAHTLMLVWAWMDTRHTLTPGDLRTLEDQAHESMLQLAFVNEGLNPGSVFCGQAARAGWRYDVQGGFFRTCLGERGATPCGRPRCLVCHPELVEA